MFARKTFFCIKTSVQVKHKTLYPLMGFYTVFLFAFSCFAFFSLRKGKKRKNIPTEKRKKNQKEKKDFPINMKIGLKYLLY